MEDRQDKRAHALGIAIKAGVVTSCEHHEDVYLAGNEEAEAAYRLGNALYNDGKLDGVFESRREMTDFIQQVVLDSISDECPYCEKWNAD